jgi:hypothetical protein
MLLLLLLFLIQPAFPGSNLAERLLLQIKFYFIIWLPAGLAGGKAFLYLYPPAAFAASSGNISCFYFVLPVSMACRQFLKILKLTIVLKWIFYQLIYALLGPGP